MLSRFQYLAKNYYYPCLAFIFLLLLLGFLRLCFTTSNMSRLLNLLHKMITTTATARLQMFSNHVNASASSSHTLPLGSKFTLDYKVYYRDSVTGKPGSWFHDVPLGLDKWAAPSRWWWRSQDGPMLKWKSPPSNL